MPFAKGDPNINRSGRLNGAKNKNNAKRDINRAVTSGMSLEDLVIFLSEKVLDPEVSDVQKNKYITQLISLKQFSSKEALRINDDDTPSKKVSEGKEKGVVTAFPQVKFSQSNK